MTTSLPLRRPRSLAARPSLLLVPLLLDPAAVLAEEGCARSRPAACREAAGAALRQTPPRHDRALGLLRWACRSGDAPSCKELSEVALRLEEAIPRGATRCEVARTVQADEFPGFRYECGRVSLAEEAQRARHMACRLGDDATCLALWQDLSTKEPAPQALTSSRLLAASPRPKLSDGRLDTDQTRLAVDGAGGVLWVADQEKLRAIELQSGGPLGELSFEARHRELVGHKLREISSLADGGVRILSEVYGDFYVGAPLAGKLLRLDRGEHAVCEAALSRDGSRAVLALAATNDAYSGCRAGAVTIEVRDGATGSLVRRSALPGPVQGLAVDRDAGTVVAVTRAGRLRIETGGRSREVAVPAALGVVTSASVADGGRTILLQGERGSWLWSGERGQLLPKLRRAALFPDGRRLAKLSRGRIQVLQLPQLTPVEGPLVLGPPADGLSGEDEARVGFDASGRFLVYWDGESPPIVLRERAVPAPKAAAEDLRRRLLAAPGPVAPAPAPPEPPVVLSGRVIDASGRAVAGALVEAEALAKPDGAVHCATTSADGKFALRLARPDAWHRLWASTAGGAEASGTYHSGRAQRWFELQLDRGGDPQRVTLALRGRTGRPAANERIDVNSRLRCTDALGQIVIPRELLDRRGPPPTIELTGGTLGRQDVEAVAGGGPRSYTGTVRYGRIDVVAGAEWSADVHDSAGDEVRSDGPGGSRSGFGGLAAGRYHLALLRKDRRGKVLDRRFAEVALKLDEHRTVTLAELQPSVSLQGVVRDLAGLPVPGVQLATSCATFDGQPPARSRSDCLASSDGEGRFELRLLQPGAHQLAMSGDEIQGRTVVVPVGTAGGAADVRAWSPRTVWRAAGAAPSATADLRWPGFAAVPSPEGIQVVAPSTAATQEADVLIACNGARLAGITVPRFIKVLDSQVPARCTALRGGQRVTLTLAPPDYPAADNSRWTLPGPQGGRKE